ncbi:MAG: hypothetical protein F6J96_13255 [Symploca sp. SIO1C2]|nr:hypothetical protein [Symploca sp. SIO1C2]
MRKLGKLRKLRKKNHNFSESLVVSIYSFCESAQTLYMGVDKMRDRLTCHQ